MTIKSCNVGFTHQGADNQEQVVVMGARVAASASVQSALAQLSASRPRAMLSATVALPFEQLLLRQPALKPQINTCIHA